MYQPALKRASPWTIASTVWTHNLGQLPVAWSVILHAINPVSEKWSNVPCAMENAGDLNAFRDGSVKNDVVFDGKAVHAGYEIRSILAHTRMSASVLQTSSIRSKNRFAAASLSRAMNIQMSRRSSSASGVFLTFAKRIAALSQTPSSPGSYVVEIQRRGSSALYPLTDLGS